MLKLSHLLLNTLNIAVFPPRSDLQIEYNPCQNSNSPFCKNEKSNLKIYTKLQGTINNQNIIEKERSRRIHNCDFRTYYKAIVIKTVA